MKILFYLQNNLGRARFNRAAVAGCALLALSGCGREEVKVYQVPREQPAAATDAELPPSHPPIGDAVVSAPKLPETTSGEGRPQWTVPVGWTEISGGQFLVAKFTIAGEGDMKAAVNVSCLAGEGGGLAANVNRWRGQIGLPPLAETDLTKEVAALDAGGGKGSFVDFTGTNAQTSQPARLVGAVVPQAGQTWFYKLMGDPKVVENQKEAFTKFVQGVKY